MPSNIPVAIQMYTLREHCAKDFLGTLAKVAEIGYAGVELAGTYDVPNDKLAATLASLKLRAVGCHTAFDELAGNFNKVVDLHKAIGADWVIVPWLGQERHESRDALNRTAATLNDAADRLAEQGLKLAYHNHAFEFENLDGQYKLDLMLDAAPKVGWEIDVYWVTVGGESPAGYIRKYSGRVPLVHLKDRTGGQEPTFSEVGLGTIDFAPIFQAAQDVGARWYVVEQDRCARVPLESARISLASLKKWGIA